MRLTRLNTLSRILALLVLVALLGLVAQLYLTNLVLPPALGYGLAGAMLLVVAVAVIWLLKKSKETAGRQKSVQWTILLLMINLPLAAFYLYLLNLQLNSVQITLQNGTEGVLTELRLYSCNDYEVEIEQLGVGEGQTVWLPAADNCPLNLYFKLNSNIYIKAVHTNFNDSLTGSKLVYSISENQQPLNMLRPERKKK